MHGAYGNWKLWANSSAVKSTNHLGHRIAPLKRLVVNSLQMVVICIRESPSKMPLNSGKTRESWEKKSRADTYKAIHGNGAIL